MRQNLNSFLMVVITLNPIIEYENAARAAKLAYNESISLKNTCLKPGFLSAEEYDPTVKP